LTTLGGCVAAEVIKVVEGHPHRLAGGFILDNLLDLLVTVHTPNTRENKARFASLVKKRA
jgi:hypothetical protein